MPEGLTLTERPRTRTSFFSTRAPSAKGPERVFTTWAACDLSVRTPTVIASADVASQEGAAIVRRALTSTRLRSADAAPPAADDRGAARVTAAGRHQLSRNRKIRPPAAAAGGRGERVRVDHGRLQQVLLVLRRALHEGRGGVAAVRRRADGSRRPGRPGRARNHAPWPERQRLPRRDGWHGYANERNRRSGDAARLRGGNPRPRAHPLHDIASEGNDGAAHPCPRDDSEARRALALARAIGSTACWLR